MFKTKTQKLIVIIILLIICVFLIHQYFKKLEIKEFNLSKSDSTKAESPPAPAHPASGFNRVQSDALNFIYKDKTPTTVDFFMQKLMDEGKVTYTEKNYSGMGKFIESINGIKNDKKNWIYYVNGIKATIGISNYKIKTGDVVSWKYENS